MFSLPISFPDRFPQGGEFCFIQGVLQGNHPSRLFSRATLFKKRAYVSQSGGKQKQTENRL